MTTVTIPARNTVRLDATTRAALSTVLNAIKAPHLSASVSDAIRAAILHAAATVASTGCLPA
jgi:hypothetical protein